MVKEIYIQKKCYTTESQITSGTHNVECKNKATKEHITITCVHPSKVYTHISDGIKAPVRKFWFVLILGKVVILSLG